METTDSRARFVGEYGSGSVDAASILVLLADGTFCFSLMAGALDHLAAGHWHPLPDGSSVRLVETRPDSPLFAVRLEDPGPTEEVRCIFGGTSMSEANRSVFAASGSDSPPGRFRLLFPAGLTHWHREYALSLGARDARHLFLGAVDEEENPGVEPMLQMVQFSLPRAHTVLIDFDVRSSIPKLDAVARLEGGVLYLDEEAFARRGGVSPDLAQEVRDRCVRPLLEPGATPPRDRPELLLPARSFRVSTAGIVDDPWFAETT